MPLKYFVVGYEDGSQIILEIETLEDMCAFIEKNKYRYMKFEELPYDFMVLYELSGLAKDGKLPANPPAAFLRNSLRSLLFIKIERKPWFPLSQG